MIGRAQQNMVRRSVVLVVPFVAGMVACGPDSAVEIEDLDKQLYSLEGVMSGGNTAKKVRACLNYASICERAAGICLWSNDERGAQAARCSAVAGRCERNLAEHCDRRSPWPTPDTGPHWPDGGTPDALPSYPDGGGRLPDAWVPYHYPDAGGGWADDARVPGHHYPDAGGGTPDAMSHYPDAGWGLPDAQVSSDGPLSANCHVGGCSSELCSDRPGVASACVWKPEFDCYRYSSCERQPDGRCGWTPNFRLEMCLTDAPKDCRLTGCKGKSSCQPCWYSHACLEPGTVC